MSDQGSPASHKARIQQAATKWAVGRDGLEEFWSVNKLRKVGVAPQMDIWLLLKLVGRDPTDYKLQVQRAIDQAADFFAAHLAQITFVTLCHVTAVGSRSLKWLSLDRARRTCCKVLQVCQPRILQPQVHPEHNSRDWKQPLESRLSRQASQTKLCVAQDRHRF